MTRDIVIRPLRLLITAIVTLTATGLSAQTTISSLSDITSATGDYILSSDFSTTGTPAGGIGSTSTNPFKGTIDGGLTPITGTWDKPLFDYVEDATIKNVIIGNVSISSGTNVGAIAGNAAGATRIYNCGINGGSVGGSGNTGGLVGQLNGTSRVINCYSYADITSGSNKGGIVGNNAGTSKQTSITTMVMNCMFYGDIADGNTISPIYGGTEITNASGGLPNYNYYRYRSRYSIEKKITKYNCALAMEEKFINRFERYRLMLNSNKKLAAWYITGQPTDTALIAKWVLETADWTNDDPKSYPVLKPQGKYPSIINIDAENAPDSATVGRCHGGKVGTLAVTIDGVGDNSPLSNGGSASITRSTLTLIRTDKDTLRYNYNYDKVQLPYYNDVGTGNYTKNRVVTGWEITGFTGGTAGTFTKADEWGGYNFADRYCTNKDLYSVSGRVFSQGAYFDVPYGVTGITIKPHWATAAYVSDAYYDVAFTNGYVADDVENMGKQNTNNTQITINGDQQKVYTTIGSASGSMTFASGKTVYDYAVVLVGNVHQTGNPTNNANPYTIMSIDENHDNEPDYTYIFGHKDRQPISPIRYDFLNIMGIAQAQMPKSAGNYRNVSLFKPKGWFEITNTCIVNFSEFEYDDGGKSKAPLILLGGTYEQFVSTQNTDLGKTTYYIHVGGNAWFAKFGNGTHSDGTKFTPHIPISVTGGDYDEFYLSGAYQPNIIDMEDDDAECYISGGHFGEVAAASLEAIHGDVRWHIDYADINNFYGGGINANNPVTGNLKIDLEHSYVNRYCGGPKFGDMSQDKTVETTAVDCTFGTFFGAGFGGNSYNRVKYYDVRNTVPSAYQSYYTDDRGKYFNGTTTNAPGMANYGKKGKGVATDFDYEFFIWASGETGSRFYVKFISFSLATTNNVSSTLSRCTITKNFYGGGNLGKVNGSATSVLDSCTVNGNVFGAGYSASIPSIAVRKTPAFVSGKEPSINKNIAMFEMGEIADTEEYEWKQVNAMPNNAAAGMESTEAGNYVYTDVDISKTNLGSVSGAVTLTIKGNSEIGTDGDATTGNVFGGGDESAVNNGTTPSAASTIVDISGNTHVRGTVFGGGNKGLISGNATVNIHK